MNCLLHIAALCLFDPSNVYLDASYEFAYSKQGDVFYWQWDGVDTGAWRRDKTASAPNIGNVELGWTIPLGESVRFSLAWSHTSLVGRSDRGYESAKLGVVWQPFR